VECHVKFSTNHNHPPVSSPRLIVWPLKPPPDRFPAKASQRALRGGVWTKTVVFATARRINPSKTFGGICKLTGIQRSEPWVAPWGLLAVRAATCSLRKAKPSGSLQAPKAWSRLAEYQPSPTPPAGPVSTTSPTPSRPAGSRDPVLDAHLARTPIAYTGHFPRTRRKKTPWGFPERF